MGKRLHLLVIIQNQHFLSALQFISCQPLKSHLALYLDLGDSYLSIYIHGKKNYQAYG